MRPTLSGNDFVEKWRGVSLKERSAYQSHFIDLCALVGHPTPVELDPDGSFFCFEKGAIKNTGEDGWADVWYKGHFALEYKGRHANLDKAYHQLLTYREALENPPLLIVCDLDKIIIRTNWTNTPTKAYELDLDKLRSPEGLTVLRNAFFSPDALRPGITVDRVTEEGAARFSELAERLRARGLDPEDVARFLIRLLFTLFAEDIGLLPHNLLYDLSTATRLRPDAFTAALQELFGKMSTGGWFGRDEIRHIDGHLFDDDRVIELNVEEMRILQQASKLEWGALSPAILGTLFERSLNPDKRSQLGAHYTSEADILEIVEPVLMKPILEKWEYIRSEADTLIEQRDTAKTPKKRKEAQDKLRNLLMGFSAEIASKRVLDPACGSGNFLYVALRALLNLEKEVIAYSNRIGVGSFLPSVSPGQLYGIEIDEYAHQLANTTVQIGYLQWLNGNGFGFPAEPILSPLNNIQHMDAIMQCQEGEVVEPEWPAVDIIIGNPPFLGDKKMKSQLGDNYVDDLRSLYKGRVPGGADLVCYWFEKARSAIVTGRAKRAGLLATNSIRMGSNRRVLDRISKSGQIFWAWSDRPWILDGAAVRVSMIGFDGGEERNRTLDGERRDHINADLTSHVDLTKAHRLKENQDICFLGIMKGGPFDIDGDLARRILAAPVNPNGRLNSDVVKRRMGGQDVTDRPRDHWIIDFVELPQEQAILYEMPFEYVRTVVKPLRETNNDKRMRKRWWLHGRSRPDLRAAMKGLKRCLVTSEVSKHRVFVWMDTSVVPDHTLHVFAREDDYFFGVIHSRIHALWVLALCSWIGAGNDPRYNSSRVFATFPLPWPPGSEPVDDPCYRAISAAARGLNDLRESWLNPPGAPESELSDRTMTNLYNARPAWLVEAHAALDRAVFAAYGWPENLSDDDILERLLELNQQRAGT